MRTNMFKLTTRNLARYLFIQLINSRRKLMPCFSNSCFCNYECITNVEKNCLAASVITPSPAIRVNKDVKVKGTTVTLGTLCKTATVRYNKACIFIVERNHGLLTSMHVVLGWGYFLRFTFLLAILSKLLIHLFVARAREWVECCELCNPFSHLLPPRNL